MKKHGFASHGKIPEYKLWGHIKERCYNKNAAHYDLYGGRGIKMCKRWRKSFPNFYRDMGKRPEGMTIERKNSNGHYSPSNCRWATNMEQQSNRSNNKRISVNGKVKTYSQWEREFNLPRRTISCRITRLGWTPRKAVLTPIDKRKQRFK